MRSSATALQEQRTDFPVAKWMLCAAACGLPAYLSQNAGTMYANHLYAEGLRFLRDDPAYRCQMLLCHVPMAEDGTDHAGFAEKLAQVLVRFAFAGGI